MRNFSSILVVVGSLCLMITLVLAWCLVGVRSSAFMKKVFPNYQNLLKAHLDYLMMTGLLMIFFLLFNHFRVSPSPLVVIAMSVGSFMNPVGFIALAINPTLRQQPASPFGAVMAVQLYVDDDWVRRSRLVHRAGCSSCGMRDSATASVRSWAFLRRDPA